MLANGAPARSVGPPQFERRQFYRDEALDGDVSDLSGGSERGAFDESFNPLPDVDLGNPEASGIPFWPTDQNGRLAVPAHDRIDVDMITFRRVLASDMPGMFGSFAFLECGPTFGFHRGVTEGLCKARPGAGVSSTLFVGKTCGWQVFIEKVSVQKRAEIKALLIEGFNWHGNGAGYIKPSSTLYTVSAKNVRITLEVWERVMSDLNHDKRLAETVTICVYGTKLPVDDGLVLSQKFNSSRMGSVDADFAFECPCPDGFPIFHSQFFKKAGVNSGTTRMWNRLGRGRVHPTPATELEVDFGTVRYQVPGGPHLITFYCKAVQVLKGECDFDGKVFPQIGKTARERISAIKETAARFKCELEKNPARWQVARVEVTVKGAVSMAAAFTKAKAVLLEQLPLIDCIIVPLHDVVQQLQDVADAPDFVGTNAAVISDRAKTNIAILQNKLGFWFRSMARHLPDFSRVGVGQYVGSHDTRRGFIPPVPVVSDDDDDDWEDMDDYIFEVPPRKNAKVQVVRFTYMAPNVKNKKVSKKKLYTTAEEAKQALLVDAQERGFPWRDYAVPKKGTAKKVTAKKVRGSRGISKASSPSRRSRKI